MFEVTVRMLKGSVNINNVSMSNYGAQNSEYTLEIGEDVLEILNGFVERGILEIVSMNSTPVEPEPVEPEQNETPKQKTPKAKKAKTKKED